MFSRRRLRTGVALTAVLALGAVAGVNGPAQAAQGREDFRLSGADGAVIDPAKALGGDYRQSSDVLVHGVADVNGYHIMVAREKDAYAWTTLATLGTRLTDLGAVTGYTCVTGSGKYAVAVYAPAMAVNKPAMVKAGGFAAVVEVATGKVTQVASRVELAYYNPACGPTDRVLLTRSLGQHDEQTELIAVDAAAGKVLSTRKIDAQVTAPTAGPKGDYGIVRGDLARLDSAGKVHRVATLDGPAFAVRSTGSGAIDVLTAEDAKAVAQRFDAGVLTKLGSGPRTGLALLGLSGGRNALVGEVSGVNVEGKARLTKLASSEQVRAVSSEGHLLLNRAQSRQLTARVGKLSVAHDPITATDVDVEVRTVGSGRSATGTIAVATVDTDTRAQAATATAAARGNALGSATKTATTAGWEDPGGGYFPDPGETPGCSVGRNSLNVQVPQPSYNQVEWAVDLAVHSGLTIRRPKNYLNTRMEEYGIQGIGYWPLAAGAIGKIPSQLVLAILAQETNLAQASWRAVPGDAGNPLVGDYYGDGDGVVPVIDWKKSDCGYGIGQVTDGMRSSDTGVKVTIMEQVAIATDYAANIAASLDILVQKWNQLQAIDMHINNNDPNYIENWYLAVWGYNSGIYNPTGGTNPYGVGWFNNPANPRYPANRLPFLRGSLDDASHPGDWPYQEKIMGWAERPQWHWVDGLPAQKYLGPTYGSTNADVFQLELPYDQSPTYLHFCNGLWQTCKGSNFPNPCPANDSTCWWHGSTGWADCVVSCATERVVYRPGDPEPAVEPSYPRNCTRFSRPSGKTVFMVDDLSDGTENVLGCPGDTQGGKFTIRAGAPTGDVPTYNMATGSTTYMVAYSKYGQWDLHQLGAGYQGHMWFTHADQPDLAPIRKVVGTWTPNLTSAGKYDILVNLPSHGGTWNRAEYLFYDGADSLTPAATPCVINQDTTEDKWVYLGTRTLKPGARVQLHNMYEGADGSVNIAYDAVAFVEAGSATHTCGSAYSG
ncbi:hypothetical protein [Actinoplanes solisilvae]|uniref:golvesin C-terminal-like domain-containing protein n=1 Tax=Actinoplanes solisilvae TaxID=2486853 RepID=UPI000FD9B10F|nr:hypothetical protein [Actinoplanes solisilvae]